MFSNTGYMFTHFFYSLPLSFDLKSFQVLGNNDLEFPVLDKLVLGFQLFKLHRELIICIIERLQGL